MAQKQLPCCARRTGKLTHDRSNLRSLAQRAAKADQAGRDISKYRHLIEAAKAQIVASEQSVAEHEAEHAGVPA